ncbi:RING/U-box [Glarea lozoyensis ATCC 20868]|uniref:RING/U-box n=1 Tax=Glarea lozoyensis (strain ATCC 20868 / MF5171) TaxID=1116229 RepID=S3CQF5_GLAL2|nr:RING/U-box [Glarea lozoyensis ATCC 20868]EPE27334.1 RING/U-box [Glarea lozoyensis ATCC 20868]
MTSLVSDFIINPVLRTARRFSRSGTPGDGPPNSNRHDAAVEGIAEQLEGLEGPATRSIRTESILSDEVLTSSPIETGHGLDAELEALEVGRPPSAPAAFGHVPMNLGSFRPHSTQVDDDVSDNPSFGIPDRFRTASIAGTAHSGQSMENLGMSPAEGRSRSNTQDRTRSGSGTHHRHISLPADDGMGPLRQQIRNIQAMEVTGQEKARLMHQLITRGYNQAQTVHTKPQIAVPTPGDMVSQERPTTPESLASFLWQMNGMSENASPSQQHTFHLSPDDLKRTYAPPDPPEVDEDGDVVIVEETEPQLGCKHYKRNVKLQCSACAKWYTCRLCHDEVEDHILDRKATKNMLCMLCGCAQGASEFCFECGERTAWYYCGVCKLWDNDSNKWIYHCNDCGICRRGRGLGKDFFHCKTCGVCMSMSVEKNHKCIERVSDCDCPICGEYMFTSPHPVVFMLCGHSIHKRCYDEHMNTSYKCPICSKSTVNMETQFRNLDRAIDGQPMPPQFRDTKAMVSCNDCYAKSAVKYHWLGLKCAICHSYNTAQLSILSDPAVEVPPIESVEPEVEPMNIPGGDMAASGLLTVGVPRNRRHSSHSGPQVSASGSRRFSPYPLPGRIGRSVSPVRGIGFFFEPPRPNPTVETDDSLDDEDELDFWGRDGPRSVASGELADMVEADEDLEEESSDDDSAMDDCEDEGEEEEDRFALFGHR